MAFELSIEIVGLCMFVQDTEARTTYVLMPGSGPEHGVDPHVARLCFDAAYGAPAAAGLKGYTTLVPVEGVELSFPPGSPWQPGLPVELVNVSPVARKPLLPGLLGGTDAPAVLTSRAVLSSGKSDRFSPGACWHYPQAPARMQMANHVWWELGTIEGDSLEIVLTPLVGGELPPAPIELHPIDGRIEVQLYYTPRDELPPQPLEVPEPPPGTPAHHFAAFYELFEPPVDNQPLPTYIALTCGFMLGGSPYTCMGAQADPPTP